MKLPERFEKCYYHDWAFGPIVRAFREEKIRDPIRNERVSRLLPLFLLLSGRLYYYEKLCFKHRNARHILNVAHYSRMGEHYSFEKALDCLSNFHCRHKSRGVPFYFAGCLCFQQFKDKSSKKLTDPQPLSVPSRRWAPSRHILSHIFQLRLADMIAFLHMWIVWLVECIKLNCISDKIKLLIQIKICIIKYSISYSRRILSTKPALSSVW